MLVKGIAMLHLSDRVLENCFDRVVDGRLFGHEVKATPRPGGSGKAPLFHARVRHAPPGPVDARHRPLVGGGWLPDGLEPPCANSTGHDPDPAMVPAIDSGDGKNCRSPGRTPARPGLSRRRAKVPGLLICLAALAAPQYAMSHAALIEAEPAQAIRLHAFYDSGAPMSGAQVMIYAPDDPASPWGQGVTDGDGRYQFIPDATEGRWSVQIRQAGHGTMAHVQLDGDAPATITTSGAESWMQRAAMLLLAAWGALGTALFALSRKGRHDASA